MGGQAGKGGGGGVVERVSSKTFPVSIIILNYTVWLLCEKKCGLFA